MKITVIGNSHTVAIRNGWKDLCKSEGTINHDVEFFAIGGDKLKYFSLNENGIFGPDLKLAGSEENLANLKNEANEINGCDSVNVSSSDAVILVGLNFYYNALIRTIANVNVSDFFDVDREFVCISKETLDGLAKGLVAKAVLPNGDWNLLSDRPLLILRQPWLSQRFLEHEVGGRPGKRLNAILQEFNISSFVKKFSDRVDSKIGSDGPFDIIGQPDETIFHDIFTGSAFSVGATRLNDEKQPINDVNHANSKYGVTYWLKILNYLADRDGLTSKK